MWPKTVVIHGIEIGVDSWEDVQEVVSRFGTAATVGHAVTRQAHEPMLSLADRDLLAWFVEAGSKGLPRKEVAVALGARGRMLPGTLQVWAQKVELVASSTGTMLFEPIRDARGRRIRVIPQYMDEARRIAA